MMMRLATFDDFERAARDAEIARAQFNHETARRRRWARCLFDAGLPVSAICELLELDAAAVLEALSGAEGGAQ